MAQQGPPAGAPILDQVDSALVWTRLLVLWSAWCHTSPDGSLGLRRAEAEEVSMVEERED